MAKYTPKPDEIDAVQWMVNGTNTLDILTQFFDRVRKYDYGPAEPQIWLDGASRPVRPGDYIAVTPNGAITIYRDVDFADRFDLKGGPVIPNPE